MIKIYHHNDADGRLSAAIARKFYGGPSSPEAHRYTECAYGPPPENLQDVDEHDIVVVVDYSFPDAVFAEIRRKAGQVVWIDHHKTCEHSAHLDLDGVRSFVDKGPAACELTWKHFFPEEAVPEIVSYVGDYDSWRLETAPLCFQIYEAAKGEPALASPEGWLPLLSGMPSFNMVDKLLKNGEAILRYRDGYLAGLRKSFGHVVALTDPRWQMDEEFAHHGDLFPRVYALNTQQFGSAAMGEEFPKWPFVIAYCHDGNKFQVSLYSQNPKVDCGALAKAFGGGGHKGSAGFWCEILPWTRDGKVCGMMEDSPV